MILVDTSVWVDHLRRSNKALVELLNEAHVVSHPFVIGELACGNLKNRKRILELLQNLPLASLAEHEEVFELVETRKLMGQGIGWIDAHLLASTLITGVPLWTLDKKLKSISASLGVLF